MALLHAPQDMSRTGTDNLPVLNTPLTPAAAAAPTTATLRASLAGGAGHGGVQAEPQAHSHEGLNTPSVWRTKRTHAAAKVDALASNGIDEIEIPAFLRKQAD